MPGSTPRASRSGSAMRTSRPRRPISTPTWNSNAERSTACPRSMTGHQPATKHPMPCSRSSQTGDTNDGYVDRISRPAPHDQGRHQAGQHNHEGDISSPDPSSKPEASDHCYTLNCEEPSYTHLRAHETKANLVCRLLL